jgi:steroid delta-isomerase-like uncharacterized protein
MRASRCRYRAGGRVSAAGREQNLPVETFFHNNSYEDRSEHHRQRLVALGSEPSNEVQETDTMSQEDNKELVRQYLKAFNRRDRAEMSELLAEDVVEHGVAEDLHGIDRIVEVLDEHFETFPDYSGTTEAVLAEDDMVTVRYTATGTHTGEYRDIEPTGHTVEWTGMAMYRVEDDNIAEMWIEENRLGLLRQLEVVEPPAHFRV